MIDGISVSPYNELNWRFAAGDAIEDNLRLGLPATRSNGYDLLSANRFRSHFPNFLEAMSLSVSLIIATRDRPRLLRDALESVRQQTERHRIGQVLVSEGGSSLESKGTCELFPDLPITYFDHRPPMLMAERIHRLWEPINRPLVALLHDDDWWTPEHVEEAVPVLEADPACAAVYALWYESYGPNDPCVPSEVAWLVWIATGCDFGRSILMLDDVAVLNANLLNGSCHYSTLVGRREAIWSAYLNMLENNNMFDNDRLFPIHLSSFGRIGYLTKPNAFVRLHAGMDSMRPEHGWKMFSLISHTTRWLLETRPDKMRQAVKRFNEAISSLPIERLARFRQAIFDRVHEPQWTTLVEECGLRLPERPKPQTGSNKRDSLLEQVCPPAFATITRRVRRRLVRNKTLSVTE